MSKNTGCKEIKVIFHCKKMEYVWTQQSLNISSGSLVGMFQITGYDPHLDRDSMVYSRLIPNVSGISARSTMILTKIKWFLIYSKDYVTSMSTSQI